MRSGRATHRWRPVRLRRSDVRINGWFLLGFLGPRIVAAPVWGTGAAEDNPTTETYCSSLFLTRGGVGRSFFAQASPTVSRIEAVRASRGVLPAQTTY